jgi:hypothetical protein
MAASAKIKQVSANDNHFSEQDAWRSSAPSSSQVRESVLAQFAGIMGFIDGAAGKARYEGVEKELITRVFTLGRLLLALFLCLYHERTAVDTTTTRGRSEYRRQPPKPRTLGTFFGKVRYWRTYLHKTNGTAGGYFPVDGKLGLTVDGFAFGLLGRVVELATKMSYAATAVTVKSFLGWSPSTKTIEEATLGLGRHTAAWFQHSPPPEKDGDVLIIQIDSKATPTATAQELDKRRGKRRPNPFPGSKRHRGRAKREENGSKKRRKAGDHSKNGKTITLVTMYTLRYGSSAEGKRVLLGPINQWRYASYAPKRHCFEIAQREANKRGFTAISNKTIQVLTDGDEYLQSCAAEFFPNAIHTNDIVHCIEYIWKAAAYLYKDGSSELTQWVGARKNQLYQGKVADMLTVMRDAAVQVRGDVRREAYSKLVNYLVVRAHRMNYAELAAKDLELATGAAEGAVRYVISQRFDEGGMRWIRERAEALLQLRCIQINGDWQSFIAFAHQQTLGESAQHATLLRSDPAPVPTVRKAA